MKVVTERKLTCSPGLGRDNEIPEMLAKLTQAEMYTLISFMLWLELNLTPRDVQSHYG